MSEEHDDRLQIEAAQSDPARFADLYEKNFYVVYAYIARRVGDRPQAETDNGKTNHVKGRARNLLRHRWFSWLQAAAYSRSLMAP